MAASGERSFDTELFLEEIRMHSFLFNTSDKRYRDTALKDNRWAVIGAQFGISKDEAQRKWKSLRDQYMRIRKCRTEKLRSGASTLEFPRPKWKYYRLLKEIVGWTRRCPQANVSSDAVSVCEDDQLITVSEAFADYDIGDGCANFNEQAPSTPGTRECRSPSPDVPVIAHPPKSKRRRVDAIDARMVTAIESANEALNKLVPYNQRQPGDPVPDDVFHYFAYLMGRFRNMSPRKQRIARHRIETVMYDVEEDDSI